MTSHLTSQRDSAGYWEDGWPEDEITDSRFATWPVQQGHLEVEIFRDVVPEEVYMRIRSFSATFTLTLDELFVNRRCGMGMVSRRRVLVVRGPFVRVESGEWRVESGEWRVLY